jgi:hypothetical protein
LHWARTSAADALPNGHQPSRYDGVFKSDLSKGNCRLHAHTTSSRERVVHRATTVLQPARPRRLVPTGTLDPALVTSQSLGPWVRKEHRQCHFLGSSPNSCVSGFLTRACLGASRTSRRTRAIGGPPTRANLHGSAGHSDPLVVTPSFSLTHIWPTPPANGTSMSIPTRVRRSAHTEPVDVTRARA